MIELKRRAILSNWCSDEMHGKRTMEGKDKETNAVTIVYSMTKINFDVRQHKTRL